VIKGPRWLLLRNGVNLKRKDRVRLRELLAANRRLATVYLLKDDLKSLWGYRQRTRPRRRVASGEVHAADPDP
jgi:transposase